MALSFRNLALLAFALISCGAGTEVRHEHFEPVGKGPPVILVSGAFGEGAYREQARRMAALGYDVLLVDSRDLVGIEEPGLRAVIAHIRNSEHALPGKVAMIGFSLGGGQLLAHAAAWPDEVGAIVIMYPATAPLGEPAALAENIKVPVLLLAGETDRMQDCCTIEKARAIAAAASARHAPLVLRSYPGAGHDFVVEGTAGYNRTVAEDAWSQAIAWLNRYAKGTGISST
jgi:dienelactone hydrolase